MRELSAIHSTNVIASVAFGTEINCIENLNDGFRVCGRKVFEPSRKNWFKGFLNLLAQIIFSVVKNNLDLRDKNNVIREDFFQLLVQMRNGIDVSKDSFRWKI